ncbi:bifunctional 2-polyprenyl-6-hydroxyphenol methylase/3-demethylubiquinol 3-O-methyltransferase UbiG [Hydrogenophaga sp.]|uniref:class I SAM-dependent methyltransferase n=1 Tax=Hydrogenophaga sp. TaxID=1904254 RepID=UPI0027277AD2|nr:class I SAM-dependent methyltransferase [Hydrogenophaga sp.]MDO8906404.1 class I SAM-dependent methyltransferase [Hydrogenophaga sp.]
MPFQRPFDPVVTFRNSQGEAARGTLTSLQRRSLVMEIYNPYSIVQVSEVLSELNIRSGERSIYKGKAVVVSLLNTGLMAVVSVTLIDEWNDLAGIGHDSRTVAEAVGRFIQDWDARHQVGQAYQVVVNEMRAYFSEVTRWLDQADITAGLPRDAQGRVRDDIFFEISRPLLEKGRHYLLRFEEVASHVETELEPVHRAFAQAAIHPLVLRAPFVYRTFAKPLGYAGDYQMVNQILGDPREGPSTYFELVNYMFLQAGVAQAHRNRVDILQHRLQEKLAQARQAGRPLRVLNVGCGPAAELQRLVAGATDIEHLEVVLMDFSQETLQYARQRLEDVARVAGHRPPRLELRHESVHQLLKRSARDEAVAPMQQFDFIYCAGLFDYLADKACARLIGYFEGRLRPGGSLLVTNVHSFNPERHWMEHFMEWYLIYRDEEGIRRLFPNSLSTVHTYTDSTNINLFAEVVKPG